MQSIPGSSPLLEIITTGGGRFYYSTRPFELTNALGAIVAVLTAYHFYPEAGATEVPEYTLYKTEEGNWYDLPAAPVSRASLVLWQLKSAIDQQEAGK